MFYSEKLPLSDQTVLKVKLTDFSSGMNTKLDTNILPLNVARNSYNFDFLTGALKTGMGFKDLMIPYSSESQKTMLVPEGVTAIRKMWLFNRWSNESNKFSPLIIIYTDGENGKEVYWSFLNTAVATFFLLEDVTFAKEPIGINLRTEGMDNFFWSPSQEGEFLTTWNGVDLPESHPTAPIVTSFAYHANRLFATIGGDKSQIWFSSDTDPTNWVATAFDGGYIELTDERGTLNKAISYNNYLYIIREYGITRLSGSGEQSEFVVRNLSLSNSKIYANTASLCGDKIIMLCRDGLYSFDGMELSKITLGFESLLEGQDNSEACSAFLDGKYYLACKMSSNDYGEQAYSQMTNNCLVEFDVKTGEYSILRGVDICALTALQFGNISKLVACFSGDYQNRLGELTHDGKVFGSATKKVWESPYTDLGYPNKNKIIKSITLLNKYKSKIGIVIDGKTHLFDISASANNAVKVPINLRGNVFAIGFYSETSDAYISNPQLEVNLE